MGRRGMVEVDFGLTQWPLPGSFANEEGELSLDCFEFAEMAFESLRGTTKR